MGGTTSGIDTLMKVFIETVRADDELKLITGRKAFLTLKDKDPVLVAAVYALVADGVDIERIVARLGPGVNEFNAILVTSMSFFFRSVMMNCGCEECKKWRAEYDTKTG